MNKYKYSVAHKGVLHKFTGQDKLALAYEVYEFFRKNNINFNESDVLRAIDRQSKLKTAPKEISLKDAVNGAAALLKYTAGSSVSNNEIVRRSDICAACPLISSIKGCNSCGFAGTMTRFTNEIRAKFKLQIKIPSEVRTKYCGVCDCSLALMVVSKIKCFSEVEAVNASRPDACWVKKTSTNYANE